MAPPARNTGSRPPRHRPGLPPKRSRPRRRARRSLFVAVVVAGAAPAAVLLSQGPAALPLTPLQARIVRIANSQLGQRTSPSDSYCNRYSAFWGAGDPTGCPAGLTAEEWCADFAAWVWRKAGAVVTYGTGSG
ncbi:MAG: hypothetical protein JWM85_2250, partial [Acidimicrobiaceae bacterium]|nr:hypothetical protein [Acidimicrobiaceae bacterium]